MVQPRMSSPEADHTSGQHGRLDVCTAIDIFGVGYNDGVNEDFPATLMVTVKPGKLSWSAGYDIARRCKLILEAHNILDVECEIRESIIWYR